MAEETKKNAPQPAPGGSTAGKPRDKSSFLNSSYFIIPIWAEDYSALKKAVEHSGRWQRQQVKTDYLLHYVNRIAADDSLFCQYTLSEPEQLPVNSVYRSIKRSIDKRPERLGELPAVQEFCANFHVSEVLLSCFATGIVFMEFLVEYGALSIDCIADFAYNFKNNRSKLEPGKKHLLTLAQELLPAGTKAEPFFYCSSELKKECLCFHMLKAHAHADEIQEETLNRWVYLLGRSYHTSFTTESADRASKYDFSYRPYRNDCWSGSQEALADLSYESGDWSEDYFLNRFKYGQLKQDYHFLYLNILNQRFAAIQYMEQIIEHNTSRRSLENLNRRIVQLKTVFSFRVISNDMLYQNVYARLLEIMDINSLLEDLQDNEEQVALQQQEEEKRFEQLTQGLLLAISVLAVFSALIDAADYFQLFGAWALGSGFSSAVGSLISVLLVIIVISGLCFWRIRRKKH